MSRQPCVTPVRSRTALSGAVAGLLALAILPGEAAAQASGCQDLQTHLAQRQSITARITAAAKKSKQMDPNVACTGFGQLVANGNTMLKWAEANKAWCQIPDSFIESVRADHGKAIAIRGQACGVARKQAQMEKQAREGGGGGGGGGLLGGNGLTGSTRLPQGAL